MANPNPSYKIPKGQTANPKGINQYTCGDRPKKLIDELAGLCLIDAEKIIARWREAALTADLKIAFQYGKDLLDRGMGKAKQAVTFETYSGQPISLEKTHEIIDRVIRDEEEKKELIERNKELEEEVRRLKAKKQKND